MSLDDPERPWLTRMLDAAAPDPDGVAAWVEGLRRPDEAPAALARRLGDRVTWLHATQGAALALPGALPGVGTAAMIAAEVGAIAAEFGLLLRNQSTMLAGMAEAHALPRDRALRAHEALVVLGLWTGALQPCARRVGKGLATKQVKKLPSKAVKKIGIVVGKKLGAKLGARRGAVTVGKLVPFGIGAVVGGGFGFATMRSFQATAERWYGELRDEDVELVEEA